MKKNLFYSVMALCMAFFASCSQEEIVSTNGGGDNKVRLSVNVSGAQPNTRATQSLDVDGYVMRCIAQAVDSEGTLIDGFSQTVSVSEGTAHFEFEAPEGVAKYIFWADYVSGSDHTASDNAFYNAEDLTAVGYRLNQSANLFNNQAADAFCASVAAGDITGNVTLKRPFARLAVRQSQVESMGLTGLTNIVPNINAGSGYNVATGEATTNTTVGLAEGETLTALTDDADFYFFCYAFAATTEQTTATTIVFNDGITNNQTTLTITPTNMQALEPNTSRPLTPEEEDNSIQVDIEIDNGYGDEPTLKVGAYVNANGEPVAIAEEAVAIVFDMAADDVIDNYGEEFTGKTVKAWAVALGEATQQYWVSGVETLSPIEGVENPGSMTGVENNIKGYANTQAIQANGTTANSGATFPALEACVNWATTISETNTSGWYMPAIGQVKRLYDAITGAEASSALASLGFEGVILSSTHYTNSGSTTPMGVQFTTTDKNAGTIRNQNLARQYGARPIVTIFE